MVLTISSATVVSADAAAAATVWKPPALAKERPTPVKSVVGRYHAAPAMPKFSPQPIAWPSGTADVSMTQATSTASATRAGSLPVWFSKPSKAGPRAAGAAHVEFADRPAAAAAGVDGVLLSVRPAADGATHVKLSYSSFRDAYGGDWSSRLHLVTMPACALTTPAVAACRLRTPVPTSNDTAAQTLQADLSLSASAVLAATADTSGGNGDFSATSLQPSGSWQSGGAGDSFVWSYPVSVPEVPGGLEPNVSLTYDSQSQDGLTSSTNNQASWIGDGWGYSPGFIERSYQSCHENPAGPTKTQDVCWSSKNTLTMSLNGGSSTLVKDDTTGVYHAQQDRNEKVEYLSGSKGTVNGAQNGEYWRVTTDDGTQYYFGQNRLPGWTGTSTPTTNSVLTEPVFETDSSRPCYKPTFASSYCQQAYRWNLDYVVDTHKNTVAYFYATQQNYYAHALGTTADVPYIRDAWLTKIQYGQRDGAVYSTSPAAQVSFTTNGRCDTAAAGCATSTLTASTASHWPDVPFDATCSSGATCKQQGPAFWSNVMLTGIQTQALVGTTESNVDQWSLSHSFPATGDSTTQSLWLDSITHTGQDANGGGPTAPITLNAVTFTGKAMSNRVNVTNGYPPLTRHRLTKIVTETGETISIGYSSAICPTCAPTDAAQNTTLAYPAYWTPPEHTSPMLDWFNKYVVTAVAEQDATDITSKDVVTTYTPVGKPAWHYDTNPLTPANRRTWNGWRGFEGMTVSTGNAPDPVMKTTYTYFRGMNGDYLTAGSTRSVSITNSRNEAAVTDDDPYAGMTYETQVYNGSEVVSDTITDPWSSPATATQQALGAKAYHTGQAKTRVYTPLASGATRETETDNTHDGYGRVTAVSDRGDVSTTADDLCTTTTFADSTADDKPWILDATAESRTVKVACGASTAIPGDVVSVELSYYDSSTTLGAAPTIGDLTETQKLKSYDGTTPTYVTSSMTVDQYGRPTSATDANNHVSTTVYTPATGAQPTTVTVTDPLKYTTTRTYDSLRGLAKTVSTPAGYVTTAQYDALGRVTAVFDPGRSTGSAPSVKYTYSVSNSGPSVVTTCTLNHDASGCTLSETLFDSKLRARETQSQTATTGRVQTDTWFNTTGQVSAVAGAYYSGNPIGSTIQPAQDGVIASETAYLYDGVGRKTTEIAYHNATETWRTTHTYGGNFVTTTPPAGGTASTTVTDARGHTVTLRQYHAGIAADYLHAAAGGYDDTNYTYTPAGEPASETDNAGNTWSWGYDLLGEQIQANDPDTGITTTAYDLMGHISKATNAEQQTTTTYDNDGRETGLYDTTNTQTLATTNKLAAWTYDSIKKGLPTAAISYSAGDTFTDSITGYSQYATISTRKLTLTGTDAALLPTAGYTYSYGYNLNGTPATQTDPAIADLPNENLFFGYDTIDQPTTLTSTGSVTDAYVTATGYTNIGQPKQYTLNAGGSSGAESLSYDDQTQALTGITIDGFGQSGHIDDVSYTYGNGTVSKGAGLLTKIVDKQNAATIVDTQCFTYDYAQHLQQAWTATDDCTATPDTNDSSMVGAPTVPYWQSWTYDKAGDRLTQTDHNTTGITANDTITTYHYPTGGQPHTLSNTTATGPDSSSHTGSYTYDKTGNTATITGGAHGNESLTWTVTGNLSTDTAAGGSTSYVYDAAGNKLIQRDPASTTLFLGDQQIVHSNNANTSSGTRYYSFNGATLAVRNGGTAASYLFSDRQGTGDLTINTANNAVTRRQYLPFGEVRGSAPSMWTGGNRGFVGGSDDTNTGLETLGARQYDPTIGRFLSADPVLEPGVPQQLNGYDYADNNPVTFSDPAGTDPCSVGGQGCGTQGKSGTYYPTMEDAALKNDSPCDNDTVCGHDTIHLQPKRQPTRKSLKDPALGKQEVPLGFLRDHGYTGSPDFTYAEALKWSKTSYLASMYVCEHVFNVSAGGCGDHTGTEKFGGPAWVEFALFFVALYVMAGDGDMEEVWDPSTDPDDLPASESVEAAGKTSTEEDDAMGSCLINSFTPDTPVLMADGTTKPIKDVRVGDKVQSIDPITSMALPETVTQIHDNLDTDMTEVIVSDSHGHSLVQTTQHHRFWDMTTHRWTEAGGLRPGDQLASTSGDIVRVQAVRPYNGLRRMLNLTVSSLHTYYVLAGGTAVLVHNDGGVSIPQVDDPTLQKSIDALFHGLGNPDLVGDGSALAAANKQAHDGELLYEQDHLGSTAQIRNALNNWLTKDIRLKGGKMVPRVRSAGDVKVARSLVEAIDDAHAGEYEGLSKYGLGCDG